MAKYLNRIVTIIALNMRYPTQLTAITDDLSIYIPDYEQVRIIYEARLIENSNEPFPFWAKLWPSSIALIQFIKANTYWIKDKNILEIGAGLGLPSFMFASIAKSILVSDYMPEAVELMEKNIQQLPFANIQAMQLDWNHVPDTIIPELVLLSDVNYNPTQFESLIALIKRCIANDAVVIMATPQRIMASPFVNALEDLIHHSQVELVNENEKSIKLSILVLTK